MSKDDCKWVDFMLKKLFSFFPVVMLLGCGNTENQTIYERTEIHMEAVIEIRIFHEGMADVLDKAFEEVARLEEVFTVNNDTMNSEVEKINAKAGLEPVSVSEQTFTLIQESLAFAHDSSGNLNIAIGPLTRLWNIGFEDANVPTEIEINDILPLLDYNEVVLNPDDRTVFLERVGMRLDLGGVAKGFMADEVSLLLQENDVTSAIINIGGDVFVLGGNPSGNNWNIGIRDSLGGISDSGIIGTVSASDMAVVTSGVYERYIERDDVIYHHILDPQTGFPFDNDIVSVSIVAPSGFLGEVYTTIAFALGIEEGLAYIESVEGVEALFISEDNGIYLTSGLIDLFTIHADNFEIR